MIVNRVGLAPLFQAVAPPPGIGDPDIKTYKSPATPTAMRD